MIARMLSRYADAHLRAALDKTREHRDKFRTLCHQFDHRNQQLRAELDGQRRALETQAALTERWRGIAQGAQADLRAALNQEKQQ